MLRVKSAGLQDSLDLCCEVPSATEPCHARYIFGLVEWIAGMGLMSGQMPMGNNAPVASLEGLLGAADFVTLHVPLSDATANMIGAAQIAHMRKGRCAARSRALGRIIPPLLCPVRSAGLSRMAGSISLCQKGATAGEASLRDRPSQVRLAAGWCGSAERLHEEMLLQLAAAQEGPQGQASQAGPGRSAMTAPEGCCVCVCVCVCSATS